MNLNLTIIERVAAALGLTVVAVAVILVLSWSHTGDMASRARLVREVTVEQALLLKDLQQQVELVQEKLTDISATRGQDGLDDGFKLAEAAAGEFRKHLGQLKGAAPPAALEELGQRFEAYYAAGRKMAEAYVAQGPAGGNPLMHPFDQESDALRGLLDPLVSAQVAETRRLLGEVNAGIDTVRSSLLWFSLVGLGLLLTGGAWFVWMLHSSLGRVGQAVADMAKGDLTIRAPIDAQRDEVSQVARNVNALGDRLGRVTRSMNLHAGSVTACASELVKIRDQLVEDAEASREIVAEVSTENNRLGGEITAVKAAISQATSNLQNISTASTQLCANITTIAAGAEEASANINTMASAAEEITANIAGVNGSLEQVNRSVGTVAASIQEMNGSLHEVRSRCQVASQESDRAARQAQGAQGLMEKLSESAREIGNVVELINSITDQTNMLALNAAIEAAGAGAAGKGFAVVANEVKELARQTGEATRLIAERVEQIQDNTREVFGVVEEITSVVGAINKANQEILHAVDEQSGATTGIARSMDDVSTAAEEVTRNAQELGMAAEDVARAAHEAALGTAEVARSASEGALAAEDVANQSQSALSFASSILESAANTERSSERVLARMGEAARVVRLMQGSASHFQNLGTVLQNMANALYASITEVDAGNPPFNIRSVKYDHFLIQARLCQARQGRVAADASLAVAAEACAFGQWLRGKGQANHGELAVFKEAQALHGQLHAQAQTVVQLLQKKDEAAVAAAMDRYLQLQIELFHRMDTLYLVGAQEQKEFFPWDDKLLTGIKFVDDDHKRLVEMVNQFHRAMLEGQGREAVGKILDGLVDYTVHHFKREEVIMEKHAYPDFKEHKQKHDLLVTTVGQLVGEFMAGHFAVGIELLFIARMWLVEHIMGTDQKFAPFFQARGEAS